MVRALPQFSIAPVNALCAGASVGIAAACDVRYMAESALLNTAFSSLGMSGDFGVSYFLADFLGQSVTRDWMLPLRRITSAECAARRFATAVFPEARFLVEVEGIATPIAQQDPDTRAAVFQKVADSRTESSKNTWT